MLSRNLAPVIFLSLHLGPIRSHLDLAIYACDILQHVYLKSYNNVGNYSIFLCSQSSSQTLCDGNKEVLKF